MIFDVGFHAFFGIEGVVANGAFVNLLAVVSHLVELQNVVVAEGFTTDFTRVRFFAGVGSRVNLERKNQPIKNRYN